MKTEQNKKEIMSLIKGFFKRVGGMEVEMIKIEENVVLVKVNTSNPELFIGKHGVVLNDFQYILAKMLRRKSGDNVFVDVDINQYKEKKNEYLKKIAQEAADEVVFSKKEKILAPMSSYERRIIHLALSERDDVKTESIGEEPKRRVVIKPV